MSLPFIARRTAHWLGRLLAAVMATAQPRAAEGPVVKMSPYEVTASSVQFKHWIKVSSPHFCVYTDVSALEAMTIVREMEMLHLAAQQFFGRPALRRSPMIFVLPASGSDWRKLESKGHVEWKVAISDPAHTVVDLVLAHYDWQERDLDLVWAELGAAECYWLNLPQSLWFERGVMGFLQTAEFTKDSIRLGRVSERVRHVEEMGWLPWGRLFAVTENDREYKKDGEFQRFAGQCIAFVQYMLAHREPVWVERLMAWNALTDAGVTPTEAEFQAVFGQDWKTWQKTMTQYLGGGTYKIVTAQFKPEMLKFDLLQLDAPPREMRELFILGQILNQNVPASRVSLDSMLAKGLETEALREILVEACLKWDRHEAVSENLGRLIAAKSTNPEVYALAAKRALGKLAPQIGMSVRLGPEADEIRRWCARALWLEPRHADANNALALTLALGREVSPESVTSIQKIYRTLSGNASTSTAVAALAIAYARTGDSVSAREVSGILRDSKFSDARAKQIAENLLAELERGPNAETASAPVASPP